MFSLHYDVFYFIKEKKKKLVVTQQIDLMTFSLTNSGLRGNGWNLSERKKNKAYTIFLS